jgi:hypothetical protein
MSDEIVVAAIFSSEMEAGMAQQMLEGSGVRSFVSQDDAGGMEPQLQRTNGVRLLVNRLDIDRAREILATLNSD